MEKSFDLRPALIFKKASTSADCYVLQEKFIMPNKQSGTKNLKNSLKVVKLISENEL